MATTTEVAPRRWTADPGLLRCPTCRADLIESDAGLSCPACAVEYPVRDGVLVVKDQATADNKIAQDFYNSALWPKFRFWERVFWASIGGERKGRDVILRHLPKTGQLRMLDVAIGDGVYTSWLPADWSIIGVDVSTYQLGNCRQAQCRAEGLTLDSW